MDSDHTPTNPLQRLRDAVWTRDSTRTTAIDWEPIPGADNAAEYGNATVAREGAEVEMDRAASALIASLSPSPGACPVVAEWIPIASDCEMPGEGQVIVLMDSPDPWLAVAEWRGEFWQADGDVWRTGDVRYWLKITLPPMVPKET